VLILVALAIILPIVLSQSNDTPENEEKIEVVFDASRFVVEEYDSWRGVTEKELFAILGKPDGTEEWNHKTVLASYPVRTLTYGNWEYHFNNDKLQRISNDVDDFPFNGKDSILPMFGLKKYGNTRVNDTGLAYRAYSCGVRDLWVQYEEGQLSFVKISYGALFDQ